MAPSLTAGCINKILSGENVPNPVIQILGCKKCPGTGDNSSKNERYRLLISDGVTGYSYATLGTQLNQMVANQELEKFTVVKVDKYVCNQVQTDRKVIFLLNLSVMAPGIEVKEKLGNPITAPNAVSSSERLLENEANRTSVHMAPKPLFQPYRNPTQESMIDPESGTISVAEMVKFLNLENHTMVPTLSNGVINKFLNAENVPRAVLQVLSIMKFHYKKNYRYCLMVSDGITAYPYFILGTHLNGLVDNDDLEPFSAVRVERYSCLPNKSGNRKVITLVRLTILVPGSEVNRVLGNPFGSNAVASSTAVPSGNEVDASVPGQS